MADVAVLGIKLDTTGVLAGIKVIEGLPLAANRATDAVTGLGKAAKDASAGTIAWGNNVAGAKEAIDRLNASAKPAVTATTGLAKASTEAGIGLLGLDKAAKSGKTSTDIIANSTGLARYELINLGRQAQDVGVSLMGGQAPLTVLAQQGSQIFDVFSSSKTGTVSGFFKQLGSGIASVVTPARLVVGGLAAVAAGGALMYSSWKASTLALDDAARSADLTTRELSKLQAAASFKGISNEDFNKGITGFAKGVYDAKAGMGGLAEVFAVNNKHASDFGGYLGTAADLIKNARNDQQRLVLLQQMGLPATMEWVRLLSGGADGLKRTKDSAVEFAANDNMVASARKFDEAWNRAWTNFGLNSRNAFQKALESGSGLFDRMERLAQNAGNSSIWDRFLPSNHAEIAKAQGITMLSPFQQRFAGDSQNPASSNTALGDGLRADADRRRNQATIDAAALQHDLQMQQQRLGALGQVATVNETVRQSELALTIARNQPGNKITDADVARIQNYAKANALGLIQIRASTDAYNLETSTLGMTTGAATAYAAVQQRINAEKLKGNDLTPLQIAALRNEASALGEAAQRTDNMRFGYDALTNAGQTFSSSIRNSTTALGALKAAGVSALDALSSKLMKMATDNLWTNAFGGSSGGGLGGIISGLFGGSNPNAGGTVLAGSTGNISVGGYSMPQFASGTNSAPGGLARINELGGEIVNLPSGAQVIPHDVSMAMASRVSFPTFLPAGAAPSGGTGSGGPVHVSVPINIDATGADPAAIGRLQQQLATLKAELPSRVVAAVTAAKKQRQL
ncbi:phage tail length tape measure family protein [Tardiphaga sp.]|uniref:phage tail length tape measure family protein n=1 Tax=Tardiphaga sp. TaxID=1926292 RepID=UPI002607A22F|nr:phage tail length tape measure family protein [Tardiphaga sp.]MDB5616103.1 hypothetical protein [Tardiphaga sp.]